MQLSFQKGSRSLLLTVVLIGIMSLFVVRLFYLQIIKHDDYVAQAAEEQIKPLTIPAKRGLIYAMDGTDPVQLVMNQTVYTMFADPATVKDTTKVLEVIRRVAGGNLRQNLETLIAKKDTRYQILGTKLTRQQAEMIKNENLVGIGFQEVSQRVYPEGGLAAQTLGFVNNEGNGQYGVEEFLNDKLVGHDGLLKSVTDVSGVPLTIGSNNINRPAKNGDNIALTIDRNIQAYTEKALAKGLQDSHATHGSVVVIDPQSGKVMAMANQPTYSPGEFTKVQDAGAFNNAVVGSPYEPGSDIKTFTMATGIDKGVIQPDSTFLNTDSITIDGSKISNATKGQTGNITMQTGLNYSLNTSVVTVAQRLGDGNNITLGARQTMYDYFHNHFAFGTPTGIEVAGEQGGTIISPDKQEGNAVRYSNMAFGQGMDLTMIQVASAFGSLVNGGTYYQPTVLAGTVDANNNLTPAPSKAPRKGVISSDASAKIHGMIHTARATFYAKNDKPGYDIGGKTGTSQTIENGKYVDNQTIGTYLGYGGDLTSRYVIMVEVSGNGLNLQGNKDAMPIFTDISNWMIDYLKLQPKM
ncbi:MAG: putative Peptidoglycan glycosyltransferase [Candidatus Saccharibacteria bacterium]|nr:putative Peptidoglycan glycosyltransferase [Candidatus Saccharibacteria bacterium]